jgi:hypothetical protein
MSYTVEIDIGAGWVDITSAVRQNSFTKTQAAFNDDHKPVISEATFDVDLSTSLAGDLLTLDVSADIPCQIHSGVDDWFTGYVRPVTEYTVSTTKNDVISFKVVDVLWKLKNKLAESSKMQQKALECLLYLTVGWVV